MDIPDDDGMLTTHSSLERQLSTISHKVKQLFASHTVATTSDGTGVRLPKLEVPTFDGNLIHWKQFWDQFAISVHNKTNISNAQKTVYL